MKSERTIFFDGRNVSAARQDIWGLINQSSITYIIITPDQRNESFFPKKTVFVTEIHSVEEMKDLTEGEIVLSDDQSLLDIAKQKGLKTCLFMKVDDKEALEQSWQYGIKYDYFAVDFDLPTNIPLELIIARLQGRKTILLREVTTYEDMELAFGCLEEGSDGVVFRSTDLKEIISLTNYLTKSSTPKLELCKLTVTEVKHLGMGVRGCIDTTDIMNQDEGMLVGSTSSGGILICSETHYLPYMNLRPFRVNAGAVHSYVWGPDEKVEYISELKAGSKVLCVNNKGETREVIVGRVKREVRPLLLIKGTAEGTELNVIVQDDWHIRVMGADGQVRNATKIMPGDELLAYLCQPGRHVGIKVNETIVES